MGLSRRDFADLLSWAAPQLRLSEAGFARVSGQVQKRVARRLAALGVTAREYRTRLQDDPRELEVLDALCRVTISRFFRDAPAFTALVDRVLPRLAQSGSGRVTAWSMACASGEEPYSLALAWQARLAARFPGVALDLLATDASPHMIERARAANYPRSIFRELPSDLAALLPAGPMVTLPESVRGAVRFEALDVREAWPPGPWDLLLCRNLVFTYFEPKLQQEFLERAAAHTRPGAVLFIGKREALPAHRGPWVAVPEGAGLYVRLE